jgi:hypothetical protein
MVTPPTLTPDFSKPLSRPNTTEDPKTSDQPKIEQPRDDYRYSSNRLFYRFDQSSKSVASGSNPRPQLNFNPFTFIHVQPLGREPPRVTTEQATRQLVSSKPQGQTPQNDPQLQKLVTERLFQGLAEYTRSLKNVTEDAISNFLQPNKTIPGIDMRYQLARQVIGADTSKIQPITKALSILFATVDKKNLKDLAEDLSKALNVESDIEKLFGFMKTAEQYLLDNNKGQNLQRLAKEIIENSPNKNINEVLTEITKKLSDTSISQDIKSAVALGLAQKITKGDSNKLNELRALLPGLVDTSKGQLRDHKTIAKQITKSIIDSLANFNELSREKKEVLQQIGRQQNKDIPLGDPTKMNKYVKEQASQKVKDQNISFGLLDRQIESHIKTYQGPHYDSKLSKIPPDTVSDAVRIQLPRQENIHQSIREGIVFELYRKISDQFTDSINPHTNLVISLAQVFESLPGNKPTPKVDIYSLASLQSASQEIKPETPRTQAAPLDPKNKEVIKGSVLGSVVAGLQKIDTSDVDKIAEYLTDPKSQNSSMALESALMKVESPSSNPKELRTLASLISTIPQYQISNFTPALREFMSKASTSTDSKEKQKAFMSLLNTRVRGLGPNEQSRILSTVFKEALPTSTDKQVKLFSDLLSRVEDSNRDNVLQSIASLPLSAPDQMKSLLEDPSKLKDHLSEEKLEELKSNLVDAGIKLLDEKGIRDGNPIDPVLQQVLRSNLKDFDLSQLPKLLSSDNKQDQKQFLDDLVTKAFQAKKEAVKGLMAADQQIEFSDFLADLKSLESMTKADDVQAEAGNKLPDSIPAYLLANAQPEQIQALSLALLEMKDTQTLQKASNEQITKLFDSVLTDLEEPRQANLISGLLTQSSPQQDQSQAQNVAKALIHLYNKDKNGFATALKSLSLLNEENNNDPNQVLARLSADLKKSRDSNNKSAPREAHIQFLTELIQPEIHKQNPAIDSSKMSESIAKLIIDLENPVDVLSILNNLNELSCQSSNLNQPQNISFQNITDLIGTTNDLIKAYESAKGPKLENKADALFNLFQAGQLNLFTKDIDPNLLAPLIEKIEDLNPLIESVSTLLESSLAQEFMDKFLESNGLAGLSINSNSVMALKLTNSELKAIKTLLEIRSKLYGPDGQISPEEAYIMAARVFQDPETNQEVLSQTERTINSEITNKAEQEGYSQAAQGAQQWRNAHGCLLNWLAGSRPEAIAYGIANIIIPISISQTIANMKPYHSSLGMAGILSDPQYRQSLELAPGSKELKAQISSNPQNDLNQLLESYPSNFFNTNPNDEQKNNLYKMLFKTVSGLDRNGLKEFLDAQTMRYEFGPGYGPQGSRAQAGYLSKQAQHFLKLLKDSQEQIVKDHQGSIYEDQARAEDSINTLLGYLTRAKDTLAIQDEKLAKKLPEDSPLLPIIEVNALSNKYNVEKITTTEELKNYYTKQEHKNLNLQPYLKNFDFFSITPKNNRGQKYVIYRSKTNPNQTGIWEFNQDNSRKPDSNVKPETFLPLLDPKVHYSAKALTEENELSRYYDDKKDRVNYLKNFNFFEVNSKSNSNIKYLVYQSKTTKASGIWKYENNRKTDVDSTALLPMLSNILRSARHLKNSEAVEPSSL